MRVHLQFSASNVHGVECSAVARFLDPAGDHDTRTDEVIGRINASGEAWFGPTVWHGMRVMRISVTNFRTNRNDIHRAVEAIKAALR